MPVRKVATFIFCMYGSRFLPHVIRPWWQRIGRRRRTKMCCADQHRTNPQLTALAQGLPKRLHADIPAAKDHANGFVELARVDADDNGKRHQKRGLGLGLNRGNWIEVRTNEAQGAGQELGTTRVGVDELLDPCMLPLLRTTYCTQWASAVNWFC